MLTAFLSLNWRQSQGFGISKGTCLLRQSPSIPIIPDTRSGIKIWLGGLNLSQALQKMSTNNENNTTYHNLSWIWSKLDFYCGAPELVSHCFLCWVKENSPKFASWTPFKGFYRVVYRRETIGAIRKYKNLRQTSHGHHPPHNWEGSERARKSQGAPRYSQK